MRFRATLNNAVGLCKIAQYLEKLGPVCIISFSTDAIQLIRKDQEGGIQAWTKLRPASLFSNYRVESSRSNNEINMKVRLDDLIRASRTAQNAREVTIHLRRKLGQPVLTWTMESTNRVGTRNTIAQDLNVNIMNADQMSLLREPTAFESPDAYVLMPGLHSLASISARFRPLSKFITVAANMDERRSRWPK
ncbi:checkpoint protein Hus1/Mec3 [Syncephalastrum racemosum]|uniref:Checkpoint protein n=1 Tax=Syncephalastrum racemosum TaxID=13706 RepID=A0A1X2GZH8_SYNRA|nr:checkpoint protein Hus1/Mec3 [Syncephalastrum racemosum]